MALSDYAEFSKTPEYKLVMGVVGPTAVYKLKRVVANGMGIDFAGGSYFFCKQLNCLISMGRGGIGTKGKALSLDKYQKYSLREKFKNTVYSRTVKIDSAEVRVSAMNQI